MTPKTTKPMHQAGKVGDKESELASIEEQARAGVMTVQARAEGQRLTKDADTLLGRKEYAAAVQAVTRALAELERGRAPASDVAIAMGVKQQAESELAKEVCRARGVAALSSGEAALSEGRYEAAKVQADLAAEELGKAGREGAEELFSRLSALKGGIEGTLSEADIRRRISTAIEAAETALELSQLPGRRGKVAEARTQVSKAIEALVCAKESVRTELGKVIGEVRMF